MTDRQEVCVMVAEVLAGIALVSSAVKGIKSTIDTAKDIKDIAGSIDDLLTGAEQVEKKAKVKQKKGRAGQWQNYLRLRFNAVEETGDGTSIQEIAAEVIEQKQVEKEIFQMRLIINKKFGPTTWDDILIMRKQRIEELEKKREKAKVLARERAEANAKRWKRVFKETMNVVILIAVAGGIGYVLYYIAEGK
tara:strand:+ start:132 stop:707 length:576 start_codon:yes stop_codon:yes gene_type:complete